MTVYIRARAKNRRSISASPRFCIIEASSNISNQPSLPLKDVRQSKGALRYTNTRLATKATPRPVYDLLRASRQVNILHRHSTRIQYPLLHLGAMETLLGALSFRSRAIVVSSCRQPLTFLRLCLPAGYLPHRGAGHQLPLGGHSMHRPDQHRHQNVRNRETGCNFQPSQKCLHLAQPP
jgi:hypothetical protein